MTAKAPVFDENGKYLDKEKHIKAEIRKLARIYKELDEEKKKVAEPLIASAAFMAVSMRELENIINLKGYTEEYQNGANQRGVKKTSEVEIYNNIAKNHLAYRKQLDDMLSKCADKPDQDELLQYLNGGGQP